MRFLKSLLVDGGAILTAWGLLIAAEQLAVGFGYRKLFVGTWEMAAARTAATPIALSALLPIALSIALVSPLFEEIESRKLPRLLASFLAGELAILVGLGVTHGRHFARVELRAGFTGALALVAIAFTYAVAPRIVRMNSVPRSILGVVLATGAWLADAFVLPRLYPAFHAGLFVLLLFFGAWLAATIRSSKLVSILVLLIAVGSCAWTPRAAKKLARADNLRIVLIEHAPILGRVVKLAAQISPPPPIDDVGAVEAPALANARALDWTGADIVLISIDALRADHLGVYGSTRGTSPHIDALAKEGVVFDAAYCPTPHTSYSVTSLMTGKYMRPLLALGLGDDSETWAAILRKYGYKTAAFYPPAVFFIDEDKFASFENRNLDFEYAKVEFADPTLRASQVDAYLQKAAPDVPLFLWVHFFEPHEPYVMHAAHPYGGDHPTDVDAYDSEIAAADEGIGRVVVTIRAQRPRAVIIVTADHGEEFGDHGGRYHGTTVFEEQVRVPLIVVAPKIQPHRVSVPVQTIDLLPTVISALNIPKAPRIRGRDDGAAIAKNSTDDGFAFAETDTMTLVAKKNDRLICQRAIDACSLYDVANDPHEEHDVAAANPDRVRALRALGVSVARENGKFEGKGSDLPDALRRGGQGDVSAAEETAALLDDARADIRQRAAEITYDLHAPAAAPYAQRALDGHDTDPDVAAWCALALVRMGNKPAPLAEKLLTDSRPNFRRAAALAFAERGDARGGPELAAWWQSERDKLDYVRALDVLAALGKIHEKSAVSALVASLDDVRMRPFIADALGAIGDPRARDPLLDHLKVERYVTTRPHEARAIALLGGGADLAAPLAHFAAADDPMMTAIGILADAKELAPARGGYQSVSPEKEVSVTLATPQKNALRLFVLSAAPGDTISGSAGNTALSSPSHVEGAVTAFDLPAAEAKQTGIRIASASGITALWLVGRD
jgi:glucan phosphoethanolaminetransferase (alkaline phosphatase superfamily)/HEAT repeat protein